MANQSDHDILITLVETVNNNNTVVLEKISDVKEKVQEVNDGISSKVNDHEIRIKSIEKIIQMSDPENSLKKLIEIYEWKKDFQLIYRFVITLSAGVGAFFGFIIAAVSFFSGIFKSQ